MVPASQRAAGTQDGDRDLLPVPVFHPRVAGDGEDGDVLLELVDLDFHVLRQAPGRRHVGEGLGQFVDRPPHVPDLLRDFLSVQ